MFRGPGNVGGITFELWPWGDVGGRSQQKFTTRWVQTCIYLQRGAMLLRFWNIYSMVLLGAAVFAVFSLLSLQKSPAPTTVRSKVWLNFTETDAAKVRCHKCNKSSACAGGNMRNLSEDLVKVLHLCTGREGPTLQSWNFICHFLIPLLCVTLTVWIND